MIKCRVKTIWQGKVAIRDKYVVDALHYKEGITITVQDRIMTLNAEDVEKMIVAKSEKPFFDRFSYTSHYLYYFNWKPDPILQPSLFTV